MTGQDKQRHAVVIGAGIVGACTALALSRRGVRVTVVDPAPPGGRQAASYGNGAFISPASIIPMSVPGLWRKVPGFLMDRTGPLTIDWASLPRLSPWLARFLLAGLTGPRLTRTAANLAALLHKGPERHLALARDIGVEGVIRQDGLLYVYANRAEFAAEATLWALRRANGLTWTELDAAALRQAEPALSDRYGFGVLVERGAHCVDPGAYVGAILAASKADLRVARATHIRPGVVGTDHGQIACDATVLTAGMASAHLARTLGDTIPMEAERGYHIELPDPPIALRRPIMPNDGKMANTMTANGLRAAGQVELSHAGADPDWRRAEILRDHLIRTYPALRDADWSRAHLWQGNRPSTPDGLPVIGAASVPGVWYGFGHGHLGLNAAPHTADLLADLMTGTPPAIDIQAFAPRRFARGAPRITT
ncbi:NAD(P)/FAD-dependent oxidoreductase [Falsirhodobacter halotolerans]|uniref:NAD(P)/FAD-dependent oxidoreductase n=1 Tax=Falsirhodobacter halotolerans TaxID=1146892 RepID=UPI001FD05F36|nr:FAD-dependent oxidoreductase [Falsirhodobacter halotolerans]MCJ8141004.1 FAD-dependent oxidoreductase [Falsirhodobacter halotolerans]